MHAYRSSRREYDIRINRVMDYVQAHLDHPLPLEVLAREACFSPFHFHRIFYAFTGETVNDFVWRIRLERAAGLLKVKQLPVTEIALRCGFSSPSNFAKALKKRFGMTATEFRERHYEERNLGMSNRKLGASIRKPGKAEKTGQAYAHTHARLRKGRISAVRLLPFPRTRVAYVRSLKGYTVPEISKAWAQVIRWATARGLMGEETLMIGIGHDNPFVTRRDQCRYDAAITLPEDYRVVDTMNTAEIPEGRYAVMHFSGPAEEIEAAYHAFYFDWLPESGLAPGDFSPFDIYRKDPNRECPDWFEQDIHILVKPL